jgi:myosin heavy subunit
LQTELNDTYNKLQSISHELEMKIEEIERLGGDITELKEQQAKLEEEKAQLRRTSRANLQMARDYKDKVEGYTELLEKQDEEIARLKAINEELLTENTDLKEEKREITDQLYEVKQTNEQLTQKVKKAGRLEAENIEVIAVNERGRERSRDAYRNRHIDKLKVEFNLAENEVAQIGKKELMLQIVDPQGEVIFDVATGSGTFMIDGKETFYTAKQEILFDNTKQKVTFIYNKNGEYAEGDHEVKIYSEGMQIGSQTFEIK